MWILGLKGLTAFLMRVQSNAINTDTEQACPQKVSVFECLSLLSGLNLEKI